jgi:hypothetical protein
MPTDFCSQNAIDAIGIFSDKWKLAQEQDEICSSIKKHMHMLPSNCSCTHLEIANSSLTDSGILLRRLSQYGKQKTMIIVPKP